MRVQIPPYTDRWMMGDRFGEVVRVVNKTIRHDRADRVRDVAHVKLDKSGKTIRVLLDDCVVV